MDFRPTYLNIISALVIGMVIAMWAYSSTFVYDAPQLIEPAKRQAALTGF